MGAMVRRDPTVVEYHESFIFAVRPEVIWNRLAHPEQFGMWFRWLSETYLEGPGLVPGAVLRGVVAPPLPYRLRLSVWMRHVEPPTLLEADVEGDLRGPASFVFDPLDVGSRVSVDWRLEMRQPALRLAARLSPPILRWGHDRVVDWTVSSFRHHLLVPGDGHHPELAGSDDADDGQVS